MTRIKRLMMTLGLVLIVFGHASSEIYLNVMYSWRREEQRTYGEDVKTDSIEGGVANEIGHVASKLMRVRVFQRAEEVLHSYRRVFGAGIILLLASAWLSVFDRRISRQTTLALVVVSSVVLSAGGIVMASGEWLGCGVNCILTSIALSSFFVLANRTVRRWWRNG